MSLISSENEKFSYTGSRENESFFMLNDYFYLKSYVLRENVEIYCRARRATDVNMAHAYCVLNN